jgi:hypothetical protein
VETWSEKYWLWQNHGVQEVAGSNPAVPILHIVIPLSVKPAACRFHFDSGVRSEVSSYATVQCSPAVKPRVEVVELDTPQGSHTLAIGAAVAGCTSESTSQ